MKRLAPWLVAFATILVLLLIWGSLRQSSVFHDEAAYLLQARIFASGHWVAPARPLPEFFEQFHVLSTPVLAGKYWPGHSLLLVPGIWLGLPALVPVLLVACMAGLLYALAARMGGAPVALLTWFIWITAPGVLYFAPTYFSELSTGMLWLAGWWALWRWRDTKRAGSLALVALCTGWCAITRPLTAIAFALPVAVVVLRSVAARRAWREPIVPLAIALACVSLVPLWSARTTGSWRTTPYALYTRTYIPLDRPGFGLDSTPPLRALPPDMAAVSAKLTAAHRAHTISSLPGILHRRLVEAGRDMWAGERLLLLPFALYAVIALPVEAVIGVATAVLLLLVYLVYAYETGWTLYYFELQPVLAFLSAMGVMRAWRRVPGRGWPVSWKRLVAVIWLLAAVSYLVWQVMVSRFKHDYLRREQVAFGKALASLPAGPAVVFVRYASGHSPHLSLIENGPDLEREPLWRVHDRGSDNARLLRRFPERSAWIYDEGGSGLMRLKEP